MTIEIDDSIILKEFYFLEHEKVRSGIISEAHIEIIFDYDRNVGMWRSLFFGFMLGRKERKLRTHVSYHGQTESGIYRLEIRHNKKDNTVNFLNFTGYFSKEELLATL